LDELIVSLDGPTAETNDRLRGAGSWKLAVAAVDLACARGLKTFINMVLTQENVRDLEDMLAFCRARGIQLHAQPIMLMGRFYEPGARSYALDDGQIKEVHQRLARWKQEGQPLMFSAMTYSNVAEWQDYSTLAVRSRGESTCMAGRYYYYIHIDSNGDIHPCVSHAASFTPKNIVRDGLTAALRHVQHHNCGNCWIAYLNERKLAFGLHPRALLEIARRG
jgi:MoaA/NifB/PqqE/SkfB family radical SAM enzyme